MYPNFYENEQLISTSRQTLGDFKKKTTPCINMVYETLQTQGRGPCDRYSHGSCFIQPNERKLLVIWGGRNDFSFNEFKDCALNDLHILDLGTLMWTQVVIYGEVPESRWGHQMCTNQTHSVIAIFGGMNLKGFCDANSYSIQIGKFLKHNFDLSAGDDVVIDKLK